LTGSVRDSSIPVSGQLKPKTRFCPRPIKGQVDPAKQLFGEQVSRLMPRHDCLYNIRGKECKVQTLEADDSGSVIRRLKTAPFSAP